MLSHAMRGSGKIIRNKASSTNTKDSVPTKKRVVFKGGSVPVAVMNYFRNYMLAHQNITAIRIDSITTGKSGNERVYRVEYTANDNVPNIVEIPK